MEVTVKVKRYDPKSASTGEFQDYRLDISEEESVLDALWRIRQEQDGTLAFRGTCRTGFCGDCTMRVSGKNRIACCTAVGNAVTDGEVTIEPIRLIKVSKDMMFDVEAMVYSKYRAVEPWIETGGSQPEREYLVPNEVIQDLRNVMSCTMCWLCDEGCTTMVVDKQFVGPAALTKGYRVVMDPRDSKTEERLHKLSRVKGMWDCCHCFEATEHCPKGIDPTERIFTLKNQAIKIGAGISTVKNHYRSFAASVKSDGWLDETRLAIETEGGLSNIFAQLKQLPLGLKALKRGKMPKPYFLHKKRKGAEKIKRIFKKWEERANGIRLLSGLCI